MAGALAGPTICRASRSHSRPPRQAASRRPMGMSIATAVAASVSCKSWGEVRCRTQDNLGSCLEHEHPAALDTIDTCDQHHSVPRSPQARRDRLGRWLTLTKPALIVPRHHLGSLGCRETRCLRYGLMSPALPIAPAARRTVNRSLRTASAVVASVPARVALRNASAVSRVGSSAWSVKSSRLRSRACVKGPFPGSWMSAARLVIFSLRRSLRISSASSARIPASTS